MRSVTTIPAPTPTSIRYELVPGDWAPGDERAYDVSSRGRHLGMVERSYLVSAREGGEPILGWGYRGNDGRWGEGRTRTEAIMNAYYPEASR